MSWAKRSLSPGTVLQVKTNLEKKKTILFILDFFQYNTIPHLEKEWAPQNITGSLVPSSTVQDHILIEDIALGLADTRPDRCLVHATWSSFRDPRIHLSNAHSLSISLYLILTLSLFLCLFLSHTHTLLSLSLTHIHTNPEAGDPCHIHHPGITLSHREHLTLHKGHPQCPVLGPVHLPGVRLRGLEVDPFFKLTRFLITYTLVQYQVLSV